MDLQQVQMDGIRHKVQGAVIWIAMALLVGCVYNFCTYHASLRLPLYFVQDGCERRRWVQRTPAMAAEITNHCWTVLELLQYKVPPQHWKGAAA